MKKRYFVIAKKALAVFLAALCIGAVCPTAFAADTTGKNYIIDNPYEGIDWDSWGNYKTQLHSHTTASDGYLTIDEYCKFHYACDYDIVALTDHGTLNLGWNKRPDVVPLMRAIKKERTKNAEIIPIPENEYQSYLNGTNPNRTLVTTKGYTLTRTKTNGMIDIPLGNELNMATPFADCHLTGYYAE